MYNLIFFTFILASSFIITFLVRKWAIRKSLLDIPNERSSHSSLVPRVGGIAVAVVWFSGLIYYYFTHSVDSVLLLALLAGIPLSLTGLLDDIIHLEPGMRFLVQILSGVIALLFIGGLQTISIFSYELSLPFILNPIALIAILWSINLFNFLDGIDGYISAEVIFIGLAIYILTGDPIGLLLVFSVLGFLFWNWQPAKIFMGDVGSTLMGFIVAVLVIYHQNQGFISIPVWLILTSVFWVDATLTLLRRIKNKEQLSQAHRSHAYQRIVQSGFSHRKTVLWASALNLLLFGVAWLATKFQYFDWLFLLFAIGILIIVSRFIDNRKPFIYNLARPARILTVSGTISKESSIVN